MGNTDGTFVLYKEAAGGSQEDWHAVVYQAFDLSIFIDLE